MKRELNVRPFHFNLQIIIVRKEGGYMWEKRYTPCLLEEEYMSSVGEKPPKVSVGSSKTQKKMYLR